ncbi:phosphate-binding protein [Mycolicibacillus trivialis]|uniref:Phosphate-binding protein n=1 Tax=Mycolicibacillus trivialis TaxID=1798 RepID=A0A1X2EIQ0_9MYCO|nr:phosphate-binding protein [Mycolicibacillus trivialis]
MALTGRTKTALGATAVATVTALTGCGSDDNLGPGPDLSGVVADCTGKSTLTGEGSTAQQNAIALFDQVWARICPGKKVAYNPTGSGAGREQFIAGQVDFAGSDSPLTERQRDAARRRCQDHPAWNLPLVFGAVAMAYNLDDSIDQTLTVTPDLLADIFAGRLTRWSDPALAAVNPGVALPDLEITPIYRSDSSGTTDNVQKYLSIAAPNAWTAGAGTEFQGGVGEGAQKSAGVVQAVQATPGSIGYVEKGFADQANLTYARIDSGSGPVALTDDAAGRAVDAAAFAGDGHDLVLDLDSLYGATLPGAYPLVLTTYEIVCSGGYAPGAATAVKSFLLAAAEHGQDTLPPAGYVPLPARFTERLVASIEAIQ